MTMTMTVTVTVVTATATMTVTMTASMTATVTVTVTVTLTLTLTMTVTVTMTATMTLMMTVSPTALQCEPHQMLCHQVRHVVIGRNNLQQEPPFLQSLLCPHVSDLQVPEPACACPADNPAAGAAVTPHSHNHLIHRLAQKVTLLQSTRGAAVAGVKLSLLNNATSD